MGCRNRRRKSGFLKLWSRYLVWVCFERDLHNSSLLSFYTVYSVELEHRILATESPVAVSGAEAMCFGLDLEAQ